MAEQGVIKSIRADQLELDLANFRHEKFPKPSLAIEYLVTRERVVDLALDIAAEGTNPKDVLGVIEKKGRRQGSDLCSSRGKPQDMCYDATARSGKDTE